MAVKDRELNEHGEANSKAPFPRSDDNAPGSVYDGGDQAAFNPTDPRGNDGASGDSSDPRGEPSQAAGDNSDPRGPDNQAAGNASDPRGAINRGALESKEGSGGGTTESLAEQREGAMLQGRGGSFYKGAAAGAGGAGGGLSAIRGRIKKAGKRQVATVLIAAAVGGGGVFGGAVVQGPLQLIHFAQKLEMFHFTDNENFSDGRLMKVYQYASGNGQRSRLGITSNIAADAWEKKMLKQSGMRPIYQAGSKRFIGYEIVDDNKAQRFLGQASELDTRSSRRVEATMGRGAKISDASEVRGGVSSKEGRVDGKSKIVNLEDVGIGDRRAYVKTMGRATGSNRLVSALANQLLVERAGVNRHPFNKLKVKFDDAAAKAIDKKTKDENKNGAETPDSDLGTQNEEDTNGDGKADKAPEADVKTSEDTKNFIKNFKSSGITKIGGGGAAVVVGVLCAAKQFGNQVEDYQVANNIMPMERIGERVLSGGHQAKSGDDVDLASMGYVSKSLYDKDQRNSWTDAESMRAEEGKAGGVKMPASADLGKTGDKPGLFKAIDDIKPLTAFCTVSNAISSLPIIKQVGELTSKIAATGINGALQLAGSDKSVDDLMQDALKAVAGEAVNPLPKGAELGNLANTGGFLASNDQAMTMGGKDLSSAERLSVAMLDKDSIKADNAEKSFVARYFNPLDSESAVGTLIDAAPSNPTQAASMLSNPVHSFASSFSGIVSIFSPKAGAAASLYDYGKPKVGFSPEEQGADEFENPYENAMRTNNAGVSLEDDLPRLNDKYGNKCFGMSVTTDDNGVHIKTVGQTEMKNVYKNRAKSDDCNAEKNTNDRFNQYRMYIADAVAAVTASCNADDEDACAELGLNAQGTPGAAAAAANGTASGTVLVTGDSVTIAKKIVANKSITVDPKYAGQISDIANGGTSCNVDNGILQLIETIGEKHTVTISSINRFCTKTLTASGTGSYHYRDGGGHAVDFSVIDGKATTGGDENALKVIDEVSSSLPSGSGIGQVNCRSKPLKLPSGVTEFNDTCNHIHFQMAYKKP